MHWKSGSLTGLVMSGSILAGSLATKYAEARWGIPQQESAAVLAGLTGIVGGLGRGLFVFFRSDDPIDVRLRALEERLSGKNGELLAKLAAVRQARERLREQRPK